MQIKYGMEQDYADFSARQNRTSDGRALVQFMEVWSGMMECAIDQGVTDLSDTADLTVQAAADAAGISEDSLVIEGASKMLDCWAYGDRLQEWFTHRPPEILSEKPDLGMNLWYASQDLLDAVPKIVDAYPCILETAPNLLAVHQAVTLEPQENTFPTMSM